MLLAVSVILCFSGGPPFGDGGAYATPPLRPGLIESNQQGGLEGEPAALHADFMVEELVYVDPLTGEETWEPVGLDPNDAIENGLRIRLNGLDYSTGAAYYRWYKDGNLYGTDPIEERTYTGPAEFELQLTVYDEGAQNSDTSEPKTIYVAEGMQLRSTMPPSTATFHPARYARRGWRLWVVSSYGDIGFADISNPYELPALQAMPIAPLAIIPRIALSDSAPGEEKLYLAMGSGGVDVYPADPTNFTLLSNVSASELDASYARRVAAVGDVMYVGTGSPDQIVTFDMSNPAAPRLVDTLILPDGLTAMVQVDDEALVVHNGYDLLTVVDLRDALHPVIATSVDFGVNLTDDIETWDHVVGVAALEGTVLFDVLVPEDPGQPITIGPHRIVQPHSSNFAFTRDRLYLRGNFKILKYDITGGDVYLMEQVSTQTDGLYPLFLLEAPQYGECVLAGIDLYGFQTFSAEGPE